MVEKLLRFADLVALGIVKNRQDPKRLRNFPPGKLTGKNTRTWTEAEIDAYRESCPEEMPPESLRGAAKIKHERKLARTAAEAEADSPTAQARPAICAETQCEAGAANTDLLTCARREARPDECAKEIHPDTS
jgi:hypothetical protein